MLSDAHKGQYFVAEADGQIVGQLGVTTEWSDCATAISGGFRAFTCWNRLGDMALSPTLLALAARSPYASQRDRRARLYVEHDNHIAQEHTRNWQWR